MRDAHEVRKRRMRTGDVGVQAKVSFGVVRQQHDKTEFRLAGLYRWLLEAAIGRPDNQHRQQLANEKTRGQREIKVDHQKRTMEQSQAATSSVSCRPAAFSTAHSSTISRTSTPKTSPDSNKERIFKRRDEGYISSTRSRPLRRTKEPKQKERSSSMSRLLDGRISNETFVQSVLQRFPQIEYIKRIKLVYSAKACLGFELKSRHMNFENFRVTFARLLFTIVLPLSTNFDDVADSSENDETLLHRAVGNENQEMVQILLEYGTNPNLTNELGKTPLHYAVGSQNRNIVRVLLENGANPNVVDEDGLTPLHYIFKERSVYDEGLMEIFFKINEDQNQKMEVDAQDKLGVQGLIFFQLGESPILYDAIVDCRIPFFQSRLLRGHTLLASPPELDIFFRTRCLVPSCECGSRFCRRWQVPSLLCRLHLVSVVLASGATL
ncbi:unnamed protein product [Trichogramma brassicae]|uniref:Uncharacterized protein n=1 Tax=Trichogramma brassicae TaxID=86971 RepID=A0A6H5J2Q5_9HYME|nr:unnamed protein product [Trichogramma brassicae]